MNLADFLSQVDLRIVNMAEDMNQGFIAVNEQSVASNIRQVLTYCRQFSLQRGAKNFIQEDDLQNCLFFIGKK